jgi:hypothetical protein
MELDAATHSLRQATDAAAIIAASYHTFSKLLPVLHALQDPENELFNGAVMAAAYAANGRDALAFAPSLTGRGHHAAGCDREASTAGQPAADLTGFCEVLAARLAEAATTAANDGDRTACREAAQDAREIAALLRS